MAYKRAILKAKHSIVHGSTCEWVRFSVQSTASTETKTVTVRFRFEWTYDKEDGFSYKALSDVSGHKRYTEEEQTWLETYCRHHYPDGHHLSY